MTKFFHATSLFLVFTVLTAILLYTTYVVYFSDWAAAFEVVIVSFMVILYSNVLALAYRYLRVKNIEARGGVSSATKKV